MSHFAKIENNIVTNVIVAEQDFINSGAVVLDTETTNWNAPVLMPQDGKSYVWNEEVLEWEENEYMMTEEV